MKVFVLGTSGVGKTPMATQLSARLGLAHVKASAWARAGYPGPAVAADADADARAAFVAAITAWATDALAADPWVSIDHLARDADLRACVIEGIRNPLDFVHLFDPRKDVVIWLAAAGGPAPTAFERGLDVIAAYLAWQAQAGLRDPARAPTWRYDLRGFRRGAPDAVAGATLDDAIDDAAARLRDHVAPPSAARPLGRRVHAPLDPPLALEVRAEHLYGLDPARVGEFVPCRVFAVSSYPGEAPTFQLRLPDGAVFSYLPPTALVDRAQPRWGDAPELDLRDLAYADCPDERVVVTTFAELGGDVLVYLKHRDRWLPGTYRTSIEWWTGNLVLHVILLATGHVALLPNHKVKFGAGHDPGFAPYRKARKLWRVGDGG